MTAETQRGVPPETIDRDLDSLGDAEVAFGYDYGTTDDSSEAHDSHQVYWRHGGRAVQYRNLLRLLFEQSETRRQGPGIAPDG